MTKQFDNLEDNFLLYPAAERIWDACSRLLKWGTKGCNRGRPARCLLLTGPSGSGKTTLLRRWAAKFPDEVTEYVTKKTVLYCEVPPRASPKALAECLLDAMGVPTAFRRGTTISLTKQAADLLKSLEVKAIILDEVQHLLLNNNPRAVQEAAEYIKGILNLGICPIILAGMPSAADVYEQSDQLKRRSMGRFALKEFVWDDGIEEETYRVLIGHYERLLGFSGNSNLTHRPILSRIHKFAFGLLGMSLDLIFSAATRAQERGGDRISVGDLRDAVNDFYADDGQSNPFDSLNDDGTPKSLPRDAKPTTSSPETEKEPGRTTRLHRRKDDPDAPALVGK
jgi:hypothetical protein